MKSVCRILGGVSYPEKRGSEDPGSLPWHGGPAGVSRAGGGTHFKRPSRIFPETCHPSRRRRLRQSTILPPSPINDQSMNATLETFMLPDSEGRLENAVHTAIRTNSSAARTSL